LEVGFVISGDAKKIDLGNSSFEIMRNNNNLYIDKTMFIEHFLNEPNSIQLIVRQRRLGKSLNLDMLKCFLTDKVDHRGLFAGTYIESSPVWGQANSAPVFMFDFKNLSPYDYKESICEQIDKHISAYIDTDILTGYLKRRYERFINNPETNAEGLLILTQLVYELTGKQSYIFIDEYDKHLSDNYNNDAYSEIRNYETRFLSAGLEGNPYLKKALMTGVMRVSRESILSGLNNLVTYDLFADKAFTSDFGLTEEEIDALQKIYRFDKSLITQWYNGINIGKKSLYNVYSVLSCVQNGEYNNYWGRSGTMEIITNLIDDSRQRTIIRLLNGETVNIYLKDRISLHELADDPNDSVFYSFLLQAGYFSLEAVDWNNYGAIKIPNKEIMNVWKEFILSSLVKKGNTIRTLFDNINDLKTFDKDVEHFLNDRLSYFDIETSSCKSKTNEKTYHVFVLGLLSAYEDVSCKKPQSNRESGDGRYDILYEMNDLSIIFEFKSVENVSQLEAAAIEGLQQIDERRYYADATKNKPLIMTAIAFCGKQCVAKSRWHDS
jgi:hypothetical protein